MSTITKLNYTSDTKDLIKEGLNQFGVGITDNDTFRSYVDKIKGIYTNWPKVTGEGAKITLSPTRKGKMELTLKGNTSQINTTGKNAFPSNLARTDKSWLTVNNDGSISINYESGSDIVGVNIFAEYLNIPTNDYRLKLFVEGTFNGGNLVITNTNHQTITQASIINGRTFSINNSDIGNFQLYLVRAGANCTIKFELEEGTTEPTDYEPYTGGKPSPSPDYPQNIHIVTGNNIIHIGNTEYPINLGSIELCKIEDYQDYLYKENGNWYKHNEIKKKIFNGSEDWNYANGVFLLSSITNYKLSTRNICLCSHYQTQACVTATSQIANKHATFRNDSTTRRFYIKDSSITSANAFKTWLNSNNITLSYRLDNPTTTQITDEILISQLDAIYNAMSSTGTTTINQTNADLPFIISASALKKGGN